MFRSSVIPIEDAECLGGPSKSETADNVDQLKELVLENRRNVDQLKELVLENRRGTTSEMADMLGVLFS